MPKEVAIESAIKGLCIGPFARHLAKEKPSTIEDHYNEFEKYYRSYNDLRKRMEEQNQLKQYTQSHKNKQPPPLR